MKIRLLIVMKRIAVCYAISVNSRPCSPVSASRQRRARGAGCEKRQAVWRSGVLVRGVAPAAVVVQEGGMLSQLESLGRYPGATCYGGGALVAVDSLLLRCWQLGRWSRHGQLCDCCYIALVLDVIQDENLADHYFRCQLCRPSRYVKTLRVKPPQTTRRFFTQRSCC